jgi:hypothetical protein
LDNGCPSRNGKVAKPHTCAGNCRG